MNYLFDKLNKEVLSDFEVSNLCNAPLGAFAPLKSSKCILEANFRAIVTHKGWSARHLSERWGYSMATRLYQLYSNQNRQIHFDLALFGLPKYMEISSGKELTEVEKTYLFHDIDKESIKDLYRNQGWSAIRLSEYFNFTAATRIHQICREPTKRAYYIDAFRALPPFSLALLK